MLHLFLLRRVIITIKMADMSCKIYKWMKRIRGCNVNEVKEKKCRLYHLNPQSSYVFNIDFYYIVLLGPDLPSDLFPGGSPKKVL
jgi:hypothetical protein